MLNNMLAVGALLAVISVPVFAQRPRGTASQPTTSADTQDFTVGDLKFHPVSGFIQVTDTAKNQSAGTIILPPGGAPVYAAMPGYDIKSAYEKHLNPGGASTSAATANAGKDDAPSASAGQAPAAAAPAASFDAASKTVKLSDGRTVTFTDDDNLRVSMPGPARETYDLHFHKASGGGVLKGLAGQQQGRVGGSLGGGGVTINLESQNGTPGGEVYDTAKGTVYANSGFVQAKSVTAAVRDAVDVIKSSAQPNLAKLNVVTSLLSNNLGL